MRGGAVPPNRRAGVVGGGRGEAELGGRDVVRGLALVGPHVRLPGHPGPRHHLLPQAGKRGQAEEDNSDPSQLVHDGKRQESLWDWSTLRGQGFGDY